MEHIQGKIHPLIFYPYNVPDGTSFLLSLYTNGYIPLGDLQFFHLNDPGAGHIFVALAEPSIIIPSGFIWHSFLTKNHDKQEIFNNKHLSYFRHAHSSDFPHIYPSHFFLSKEAFRSIFIQEET
jgi:hypothetical protein